MSTLTNQQKLASALDNHILVTANAGSGKTRVLAGRFVDALINENVKVNDLAAITFTDKAASELYAKIRTELTSLYAATEDIALKNRINNLIKDLINSNISTIHSFCSGILKEYAVEAGIDPGFTLVDKRAAENLLNDSIDKVINDSLADPELNPVIKRVIRLFKGTDNFKRAQAEMIRNRKRMMTWLNNFKENPDSDTIYKFSLEKIEEFISILIPTLDFQISKLEELNNYILEQSGSPIAEKGRLYLDNYHSATGFLEKFTHLSNFIHSINSKSSKGILLRSQQYLTSKISKSLSAEVESEYREINENLTGLFFSINEFDLNFENNLLVRSSEYSQLLCETYKLVADEFNKAKQRINCIDFEDMLILTAGLLTKETIRKNVTGKFKYIMIDEYQDTNDLQFAIFLPILGDLAAGNLYVVGDKKQSIYGFRDADLNVFNKTAKKIADNSGNSVILEHTFRLSKELTAFVNTIFPSIFSTYNPIFDGSEEQFTKKRLLTSAVDYEDTTFFDINKKYQKSEISFLINRETGTTKNKSDGEVIEVKSPLSPDEKEAKLLVSHLHNHFRDICEINNEGEEKLTVAILTRKRDDFVFLEKALSDANIPYELMGGKRFYQHQVVQDISLIFRFITDPEDDFTLYSLLRSPFFSLSDEDLITISQLPGTTVFSRLGVIANDQANRFSTTYKLLIHLKSISLESKPYAIIDFMLSKTPYLAVIQNRPNGRQYLANIRKILSQAIEFEESTFNSVFDYNEYLSGLISIEEDETQAPLALDEKSVKIMTIHQSKGLEFTTVYIFAAGDPAFSTATQNENTLSVNKELGLIFKVPETEDIFYKSKESLHFRLAEYWRKQVSIEEAKRVLYVAITRAANNLIICGTVTDDKPRKKSFLEMLFQSLNLDLIPESDLTFQISNMKIAKNENGKVVENVAEDFDLNVNFISEFDPEETYFDARPASNFQKDFHIRPESISKLYSDEIITASKFITFLECPFKYYLNYISGVANISNFAKLIPTDQPTSTDEEYLVEDTSLAVAEGDDSTSKRSSFGAVTGSIIHDYLAKMDSTLFSEKLLKELVEDYFLNNLDIGVDKNQILKIVTHKLEKYLSSKQAKEIENFTTSHNEFEIFLRYGSFYLMGVIDKIIILEDRIIIIDYKTGKNLEDVMERYSAQLDFYAFLTSRIYSNINSFELRLISIDNYDESIVRIVSRNSVSQTEDKLNTFVDTLRSTISNSGFFRNTGHCHKCKFSINNNRCFVP